MLDINTIIAELLRTAKAKLAIAQKDAEESSTRVAYWKGYVTGVTDYIQKIKEEAAAGEKA